MMHNNVIGWCFTTPESMECVKDRRYCVISHQSASDHWAHWLLGGPGGSLKLKYYSFGIWSSTLAYNLLPKCQQSAITPCLRCSPFWWPGISTVEFLWHVVFLWAYFTTSYNNIWLHFELYDQSYSLEQVINGNVNGKKCLFPQLSLVYTVF